MNDQLKNVLSKNGILSQFDFTHCDLFFGQPEQHRKLINLHFLTDHSYYKSMCLTLLRIESTPFHLSGASLTIGRLI